MKYEEQERKIYAKYDDKIADDVKKIKKVLIMELLKKVFCQKKKST